MGNAFIDNLSKTLPPVFLVMKVAKMYPNELVEEITYSSLGGTNAKEVIYSIAIISIDSPLNVTLGGLLAVFGSLL